MTGIRIRPAAPGDAGLIVELILELARYERLESDVGSTPELIAAALFAEPPKVFCDIVEWDGTAAGFAVWFYNFSTFRGPHGIYLDDLFVRDAYRGRGLGKALRRHLARRAVAEQLARLEWSVLYWNTPAIDFYQAQGAVLLEGWTTCRVTGPALLTLADP